MLHEHAKLKREMHKVYEIVRASSFIYCLHPLYQVDVLQVAPIALGNIQRRKSWKAFQAIGVLSLSDVDEGVLSLSDVDEEEEYGEEGELRQAAAVPDHWF